MFRKMSPIKVQLCLVLSGLMGIHACYYSKEPDRVFFTDHEKKNLAFVFDAALKKYNLIELRNYDKIITTGKYEDLIDKLINLNQTAVLDRVLDDLMYKARGQFCAQNPILLMMNSLAKANQEELAKRLVHTYFEKCTASTFTKSFCGSLILLDSYLHVTDLCEALSMFNYAIYTMDLCATGLPSF